MFGIQFLWLPWFLEKSEGFICSLLDNLYHFSVKRIKDFYLIQTPFLKRHFIPLRLPVYHEINSKVQALFSLENLQLLSWARAKVKGRFLLAPHGPLVKYQLFCLGTQNLQNKTIEKYHTKLYTKLQLSRNIRLESEIWLLRNIKTKN